MLGEVNQGVRVLMSGLDTERLVLTGGPLGLMQAALDIALPYVRERRQFDQPIGCFELIQAKIADMYTALQSSRAYAYQVARDYDAGHRSRVDAASVLLNASEAAVARMRRDGGRPWFGLYIDCAGRAAAASRTASEEAAEVQAVMNREGVPLLGFYSGVEVAPMGDGSRGLDWTGVLLLLGEA